MEDLVGRILEVVTDYNPYNLEQTSNIVKDLLSDKKKEISIFSEEVRLVNYSKILANQKFSYYEMSRKKGKIFSNIKLCFNLRKILEQRKINILKIDYNIIGIFYLFILKKNNLNLIIDLSNNKELKAKLSFIEKIFLSKAEKIIVPSLSGLSYLEKFGVKKEKITYIKNSINPQIFSPENISNSRITQFSEKIRLKNFDNFIFTISESLYLEEYYLLIESFSKIKMENFICIFLIEEGINFFAPRIEKKFRELDLKISVIYLKTVSDIGAFYKLSDLIIFPFIRNRISSDKINEARSMGKLILVTEFDYSSEVIKDKETGFLCSKNPEEMAEKIRYIIQLDETIKQKVQNESINFIHNHFSIRQKAKKIIELYDNI